MKNNDNSGQFIGAHSQRRPNNDFENLFNDLQAESYEAEVERKRAEQRQREAGTNKHGFADLSSIHKTDSTDNYTTGNGY